jgi:hypothetical protein
MANLRLRRVRTSTASDRHLEALHRGQPKSCRIPISTTNEILCTVKLVKMPELSELIVIAFDSFLDINTANHASLRNDEDQCHELLLHALKDRSVSCRPHATT